MGRNQNRCPFLNLPGTGVQIFVCMCVCVCVCEDIYRVRQQKPDAQNFNSKKFFFFEMLPFFNLFWS